MSFFGSVQKGSASKFASKNKVPPDFSPDLNGAQIAHPPAPLQYQGLQVGPDFAVEYEPNETPAIDGSHVLSRTLSPFMIQVEPPMAYTSQGDKSKTNFAGILEAGHGSAPSAFRAARNALLGAVAGDEVAGRGRTVEEFVSGGYKSSPSGSDGIETRDLKGEGPSRVGTPAIADLYTAVDITTQLAALVRTPPLVLLINPTNLSVEHYPAVCSTSVLEDKHIGLSRQPVTNRGPACSVPRVANDTKSSRRIGPHLRTNCAIGISDSAAASVPAPCYIVYPASAGKVEARIANGKAI